MRGAASKLASVSVALALAVVATALAAALAAGCKNEFERASYIGGLRVLAIKAEPPEVPPGGSTHLEALVVDPVTTAIEATWTACPQPSAGGSGATVDVACLDPDGGVPRTPLGTGLTATATMPMVTPEALGPPDVTGGYYLPLVLDTAAAGETVQAVYLLRYGLGGPPNHNPHLNALQIVRPDGTFEDTDEAHPSTVAVGATVVLHATVTADSIEDYEAPDFAGGTHTVTETLRVSWFATGGRLISGNTPSGAAYTWLVLDTHLPNPPSGGAPVDLYLVVRDERGGLDWAHRRFLLH
jgi:hypothetical protein